MKGKQFEMSAGALQKLSLFEKELNPAQPEKGSLAPRILGYGEMSTVFGFPDQKELEGIAFKRMAVFADESELAPYEKNFQRYNEILNSLGVETPDYGTARGVRSGKPILYAFQKMLNPQRIGHRYIQTASVSQTQTFLAAILERMDIVFRHNEQEKGKFELGLDGQISNWALLENGSVVYIDTSTPLMRENGVEQLDPELFLRVCPSYLVWIIRLLFLKDVLNRYYDLRLVLIDLIANLYKEKKPDLILAFLETANEFLKNKWPDLKPIDEKEIRAYYAEDARIWKIFLAFRRLERYIKTKIQKKEYALILPENIDR